MAEVVVVEMVEAEAMVVAEVAEVAMAVGAVDCLIAHNCSRWP